MNEMFSPLTEEELAVSQSVGPGKSATTDRVPLVPVPDDAPECRYKHRQHGAPSQMWAYHDANGSLIGYIARFDGVNKKGEPCKEYLPLTFCRSEGGRTGWHAKGFPEPCPLYNLPELLARSDVPVLVCEGEKAAEAGRVLFPDYVVTTPPHGAHSPHKADWSPLCGREIIIAPDNDEAGQSFGDRVHALMQDVDAFEVLHLRPDRLGNAVWLNGEKIFRSTVPDGWDLADALDDGWTTEKVTGAASDPVFLTYYMGAEAREAEKQPLLDCKRTGHVFKEPCEKRPYGQGYFARDGDGVWYVEHAPGGGEKPPLKICSTLHVIAETVGRDGKGWGRWLECKDSAGKKHVWAMPLAMLQGDGLELRRELAHCGVFIASGRKAREYLINYLQVWPVNGKRFTCVDRLGWHKGAYVLPDRTIGESENGRIVFQGSHIDNSELTVAGSVAEWRDHVAALAVGNSRLLFAISTAFASPFLEMIGEGSGGFHLRGNSSSGKTTALQLAASVFGEPSSTILTWRATDNGLEGICSIHNDRLLILDEMAQVDGRIVGEIAYMIANGQGKSRATRSGMAREAARWRVLLLSSGEVSLSDLMQQAGKTARTGQEIRLADIESDAGVGMGAFENIHDHVSAALFANCAADAANRFYGAVGLAWLEHVVKDRQALQKMIPLHVQAFIDTIVPKGSSGQVSRVAQRFALMAVAGELASHYGLTGWPKGEAAEAARKCFLVWLKGFGGTGNQEERQILAHVRGFFEAHGASRFQNVKAPDDARVINRMGFVDENGHAGKLTYYVFPGMFKAELCKGFNQKSVTAVLMKQGWIIPGNDRKSSQSRGFFGIQGRYYVFGDKMWGADDDV